MDAIRGVRNIVWLLPVVATLMACRATASPYFVASRTPLRQQASYAGVRLPCTPGGRVYAMQPALALRAGSD
jgi:hypothetical protein